MVEITTQTDDVVVVEDVAGDGGGTMTILGLPKWRSETGARLEV